MLKQQRKQKIKDKNKRNERKRLQEIGNRRDQSRHARLKIEEEK
jgi:hypothetical protein